MKKFIPIATILFFTFFLSGMKPAGKFKYQGGWDIIEGEDIIRFMSFKKGNALYYINVDKKFLPDKSTMKYKIIQEGDVHNGIFNVHNLNGDMIGVVYALLHPIDKNTLEIQMAWNQRPKSMGSDEGVYLKMVRHH